MWTWRVYPCVCLFFWRNDCICLPVCFKGWVLLLYFSLRLVFCWRCERRLHLELWYVFGVGWATMIYLFPFLLEKWLNSYPMWKRKWGPLSLHSEVPACVLPMFAQLFFYFKYSVEISFCSSFLVFSIWTWVQKELRSENQLENGIYEKQQLFQLLFLLLHSTMPSKEGRDQSQVLGFCVIFGGGLCLCWVEQFPPKIWRKPQSYPIYSHSQIKMFENRWKSK